MARYQASRVSKPSPKNRHSQSSLSSNIGCQMSRSIVINRDGVNIVDLSDFEPCKRYSKLVMVLSLKDSRLLKLNWADLSSPDPVAHDDTDLVGAFLALDCEYVGVGPGGKRHALARLSIVNYHGRVVVDKYFRPRERVTDFRTNISGITPDMIYNASYIDDYMPELLSLLDYKYIVGHALHNDFKVLRLNPKDFRIIDTAKHEPFRDFANTSTPSLKWLVYAITGLEIQNGSHSSVDDARAAMLLYRLNKHFFKRPRPLND